MHTADSAGTDTRVSGRLVKALAYFFISLVLCSFISGIIIAHRMESQRLPMEQLVQEKSLEIIRVISKLLAKTQALATLVVEDDGQVRGFNQVAPAIMDDPAILNILIAPGGVVSDVYPRGGNERLIGYDLFGQGKGNLEALIAKEKKELVFGGPFELVQGGEALVGRLPIWLDTASGGEKFWGLVSVTLRYPEALHGAGLDSLRREGFSYEVWRLNPDTRQRQVIASGERSHRPDILFVEKPIDLFNARWYFRIMPAYAWYGYPEHWGLLLAGACISMLISGIAWHKAGLRKMEDRLEDVVRTDALTGVQNRLGLFEELETLVAKRLPFRLHYIDLNYFKQINALSGHATGDMLLIEFCRRLEACAGGKYRLSRVGGDEFIVLDAPRRASREEDRAFWERVERAFAYEPMYSLQGVPLYVSFSRGTASFPEDGETCDALLQCADQRMYQQKRKKYAKEPHRRFSDLKTG